MTLKLDLRSQPPGTAISPQGGRYRMRTDELLPWKWKAVIEQAQRAAA
jgi:hypothetical protein